MTLKSKQDSIQEQFNLTFKLNKKRKSLKLYWKNIGDAKGCVVFYSEDKETFTPISGLLNDIDNFSVALDKTVKYYQVRCYKNDGKKIISNTIELNK